MRTHVNRFKHLPHWSCEIENKGKFRGSSYWHNTAAQQVWHPLCAQATHNSGNTMETVVPWSELEALIAPYYPKAGNGRQPVGLSILLRTYLLQHWFNLSDPGAEDALDRKSTRLNSSHLGIS